MNLSINEMPRPVRRRLKRITQRHRDGDYRRRANALLLLHGGHNVRQTAELVRASRTSVRDWRKRYTPFGEAGLAPEVRGRLVETVTQELCATLLEWVQEPPATYGYLRSRWTSEMLAVQRYETLKIPIHASTVRR